jgi:branched-chain amino acid transport system substrate-binding protein
MDVLAGKVPGSSPDAGSIPDLTYVGVPLKPATADVTPIATQVLDFNPDAIIFSGQGADCWNLVAGLGRLGWTPDKTPLVLSGACTDFDAMAAAGDLAKGVYFVGSAGTVLNDPDSITDPVSSYEASVYQSKPSEYGLAADQLKKGFATAGFISLMSLWELSSEIVVNGDEVNSETLAEAYKVTDGQHLFGSTPLSCATAPEPYTAVCNAQVSITQWDGTKLNTVVPLLSGIDLVAGTEIKPGP